MVAVSVAYKVLLVGHSYLEIGKELELGDWSPRLFLSTTLAPDGRPRSLAYSLCLPPHGPERLASTRDASAAKQFGRIAKGTRRTAELDSRHRRRQTQTAGFRRGVRFPSVARKQPVLEKVTTRCK